MPGLVKLPSERIEQLRALSRTRRMSIADLIGEFLREQIDRGNLPPGLPGIKVERTGEDAVFIDLGDFPLRLNVVAARIFAAALRWHALPKQSGIGGAISDLALELSGFKVPLVNRRGTSVVIGDGKVTRSYAPSVAFDLSDIISRAAQ